MDMKTKCEFKTFWDAYALKRNHIKAERAWERLSDKDRRAALAGIAAYQQECRRTGVAVMYAQNYLACRRWEDEIEVEVPIHPTPIPSPHRGGELLAPPAGGEFDEMEEW